MRIEDEKLDYNIAMADLDFYTKWLNMDKKLFDANAELLNVHLDESKKIRDEKLAFLLQSTIFQDYVAQCREELGISHILPDYSEPSSSIINKNMRVPTRDELIELGIIPFNEQEALESKQIIKDLKSALKNETRADVILGIENEIKEMAEGATGYLGYYDEEQRKYSYRDYIVRQILTRFSLDEAMYVVVENILVNRDNIDDVYTYDIPAGVVIDGIASNGDINVVVSKNSTKEDYVNAWKQISRFVDKPKRLPKTSQNVERDLAIIRDKDAGMSLRELASRHFPNKPYNSDLGAEIQQIYRRKSIK